MRQTLIKDHHIREPADASDYRIFENAVVYNVVLSAAKRKSDAHTKVRRRRRNADLENRTGAEFTLDQQSFASLKHARLDANPPDAAAIRIKEMAWRKAVRFDQICLVAYGARLNHRTKGKQFGKAHYISLTQTAGAKQSCEGKISNVTRFPRTPG